MQPFTIKFKSFLKNVDFTSIYNITPQKTHQTKGAEEQFPNWVIQDNLLPMSNDKEYTINSSKYTNKTHRIKIT